VIEKETGEKEVGVVSTAADEANGDDSFSTALEVLARVDSA
jgi:hypothetical protein